MNRNKIKLEKMVDGRMFKLALIVENKVFYVDSVECDENANTIMCEYNDKLENLVVISDNYFAYSALFSTLLQIKKNKKTADYISNETKAYLDSVEVEDLEVL